MFYIHPNNLVPTFRHKNEGFQKMKKYVLFNILPTNCSNKKNNTLKLEFPLSLN